MAIKFIFFDVSQTLLYKPKVEEIYSQILAKENPNITKDVFLKTHKSLSDVYQFPDVTSENFYKDFNTKLLSLLAIEPREDLLQNIFFSCKNLDWQTYADVSFLNKIKLPMGIITNFSKKIIPILEEKIEVNFNPIIISQEIGVQKPNPIIYKKAIEESGVEAEEILYLGDSFHLDYEPSKKLGIKSLIIDRLQFYPRNSFIINNLAELEHYL